MLNNESILNRIKDNYGSEILLSEDNFGTLIIELKVEKIHEIISWLNRDEVLECSYLTLIGGVHYPDEKGREFAVVYHLHSWTNNFRLRLKVFLPGENPSVRSIVDIYNGANWMERETYDFFGINFEGHPDLRRILNMDSMDYFPMRKEHELEDGTREDKDDRFFGR